MTYVRFLCIYRHTRSYNRVYRNTIVLFVHKRSFVSYIGDNHPYIEDHVLLEIVITNYR